MSFRIEQVDVRRSRDRLVAFLSEELDGHGGERHYDWLYLRNPDGLARAWILDGGSDGIVGVDAAVTIERPANTHKQIDLIQFHGQQRRIGQHHVAVVYRHRPLEQIKTARGQHKTKRIERHGAADL